MGTLSMIAIRAADLPTQFHFLQKPGTWRDLTFPMIYLNDRMLQALNPFRLER